MQNLGESAQKVFHLWVLHIFSVEKHAQFFANLFLSEIFEFEIFPLSFSGSKNFDTSVVLIEMREMIAFHKGSLEKI